MFNAVLQGGQETMARERCEGETMQNQEIILGVSLNSLWEWSLPSLGRSQCLAGFPRGGVWTKATPRGGGFQRWMSGIKKTCPKISWQKRILLSLSGKF